MLTLSPRASRTAAKEAVTIPFPSEETTPPVTKMYWVVPIFDPVQASVPEDGSAP